MFSLVLLAVFTVTVPATAQYAIIPGDIPPISDFYRLDVVVTHPCSSASSIPGITDEEVYRMENPGETQILFFN